MRIDEIRKIETLEANKKKPIKIWYLFFILSKLTPIGVYTQKFHRCDPRIFLSASKFGYIVNFVKLKI